MAAALQLDPTSYNTTAHDALDQIATAIETVGQLAATSGDLATVDRDGLACTFGLLRSIQNANDGTIFAGTVARAQDALIDLLAPDRSSTLSIVNRDGFAHLMTMLAQAQREALHALRAEQPKAYAPVAKPKRSAPQLAVVGGADLLDGDARTREQLAELERQMRAVLSHAEPRKRPQ